jgi:hypothetical protein
MRQRLFLVALAIMLAVFALSTPATSPQPQDPKKTTPSRPARQPTAAEIRDYQRLRAELDKRQLIESVLRANRGLDRTAVVRQLGGLDSSLASSSREDLEDQLGSIPLPPPDIHRGGFAGGFKVPVQGNYYEEKVLAVIGEDDSKEIAGEGVSPGPARSGARAREDDKAVLAVARSVAAIVRRSALKQVSSGWVLHVDSLKKTEKGTNLCTNDRDYGCPAAKIFGTGFLVEENVIATAGHVAYMKNGDYGDFLDSAYVLFDYTWGPGNTAITDFTNDQVYEAKSVLARRYDTEDDWALIELDRAVVGRTKLECRAAGQVSGSARVYMIGHPSGLPQRLAPSAEVFDTTVCSYFYAGLDSWPGNSGSPVFNAATNLVEGLLVRDILPYEECCGCATTARWKPQLGRPGVDVVRTTEFIGLLSQPDSVLVNFEAVQCSIAVLIPSPGRTVVMTSGESRFVEYCSTGLHLVVTPGCLVQYRPYRGSVWNIVDADVSGLVKMEKVCFP